jgi:hypothetical protein
MLRSSRHTWKGWVAARRSPSGQGRGGGHAVPVLLEAERIIAQQLAIVVDRQHAAGKRPRVRHALVSPTSRSALLPVARIARLAGCTIFRLVNGVVQWPPFQDSVPESSARAASQHGLAARTGPPGAGMQPSCSRPRSSPACFSSPPPACSTPSGVASATRTRRPRHPRQGPGDTRYHSAPARRARGAGIAPARRPVRPHHPARDRFAVGRPPERAPFSPRTAPASCRSAPVAVCRSVSTPTGIPRRRGSSAWTIR